MKLLIFPRRPDDDRRHYDPQHDRNIAWMRVLAESFGAQHPDTATLRARFEWLWDLLETGV